MMQKDLLMDADQLRLDRHAKSITAIANHLLDLGSVVVTYVENGKELSPLDKPYVDRMLHGEITATPEIDQFVRRDGGRIEWLLNPGCHRFNPDDPSAIWYYSNSFFRLHQDDPFSEADVEGIIEEVCALKDVVPDLCENMVCMFSLCMKIALGLIPAPDTYLVSVRPTKYSRNFECLGFRNDYWYNALCTLGPIQDNSHIGVSFTPYLDADNKCIPDESENTLSAEYRRLFRWDASAF